MGILPSDILDSIAHDCKALEQVLQTTSMDGLQYFLEIPKCAISDDMLSTSNKHTNEDMIQPNLKRERGILRRYKRKTSSHQMHAKCLVHLTYPSSTCSPCSTSSPIVLGAPC